MLHDVITLLWLPCLEVLVFLSFFCQTSQTSQDAFSSHLQEVAPEVQQCAWLCKKCRHSKMLESEKQHWGWLWMVYNWKNPWKNGWLGGTPILGNLHITWIDCNTMQYVTIQGNIGSSSDKSWASRYTKYSLFTSWATPLLPPSGFELPISATVSTILWSR